MSLPFPVLSSACVALPSFSCESATTVPCGIDQNLELREGGKKSFDSVARVLLKMHGFSRGLLFTCQKENRIRSCEGKCDYPDTFSDGILISLEPLLDLQHLR